MKPVVRVQRLQRRSTLKECEARDFFSSSSINPAIFNLAFERTSIFCFSLEYLLKGFRFIQHSNFAIAFFILDVIVQVQSLYN